ncbi:radical SAM family heme chaperone HemW [Chitinophagaceae bacterium LB-8]|uniref:Heme chaperone HemW n=1 Tax=Paraflavisolibacter caeni TaxID=2982496 RepID=A0A9X2XNE0_9BACT|nr:radical SAM family heme chaperone HemW [Paraflavisolibacter caeni]MCU7548518.1 radical SAM family heme chaperone HemW [Paraflavisolibacter caeni]
MAGIYLHIPFCRQACAYCNFHFTTSLRYKNEFVQALIKEIELQKDYLEGEPLSTIYFGGGTPSLLSIEDCQHILNQVHSTFAVLPEAEITLEANPDNISKEMLDGWKSQGINRLSIGIQSFFEDDLRWMNRAHNADQAFQCIEESQKAGFHNLNIDLIYGSPLLSDERWKQNVETANGYNIPHLSCYALTVEEKTPLHKQIRQHKKEDVDPDKQARHFQLLMQWLKEKGYEHYEVSNFALPGCRSRHNSSYWRGEKYLGVGPSAHSFNGNSRQWNVANNMSYIEAINKSELANETEILTPNQQLNEYIMISLRTLEGMDLDRLARHWGREKAAFVEERLKPYADNGLITRKETHVSLTEDGMLLADGIAAELFFV